MLTARPRGVQARGTGRSGGERAPGGPTPHNGTGMSPPGSVSPRPLPVLLALVVTALGVAAMLAGGPSWRHASARASASGDRRAGHRPPRDARPGGPGRAPGGRPGGARIGPSSPAEPRRCPSSSAPRSGSAASASWRCSPSLSPPSAEYLDFFRRLHAALAPSGPLDAPRLARRDRPAPGAVRGARHARSAAALARRPGSPPPAAVDAQPRPRSPPCTSIPTASLFTFVARAASWAPCACARGRCGPPSSVHVTLNALTFLIAPLVDDPSQAYTPQPALGLACLVAGAAVAWPLLQRAAAGSVDSPRSAA